VRCRPSTYEAADDEGFAGLVVVDTLGDEVELLAFAAVASLDSHGDQVLTEVTGSLVDGEAGASRVLGEKGMSHTKRHQQSSLP
jgi:hypothetical protein